MAGNLLQLAAPCKINLVLRVVGRRPDGYHELITWMQKLDLYDELELRFIDEPVIRLFCNEPGVPEDNSNLAYRAAAAFYKQSSRAAGCGVEIQLRKKIPSGAGLGGGSSDAGTVLRGLNRYFNDEFSEQELVRLALPLGADVPLFAVGHSAVLATGVGEVMEPVAPLDNCTIILVNPGFSVSTKWVFENYALTTEDDPSMMPRFRELDPDRLTIDDLINDLEPVTSRRFSEIERMKKQLLDAGAARAMMSGSGPTVFGIFPDEKFGKMDVHSVAEKLRLQYKDRVFVTRSCAGAWPSGQGTGF